MPKSTESLNRNLFDLLRSRGFNPITMDTSGKDIPVPEDAEVIQFDFIKDNVNYGKVTISIDGLKKLIIYFSDDIADSDKGSEDSSGSDWYSLLKHLKRFAKKRQLSFELKNSSHLKHDMAKREYMKNKEKINEGYYPMGKKASYSDAIPSIKIVIEHSRQLEENEARFRSVNRIFLENQLGERFLLDTKKPGIARVYARHIAEGGKVNDQRWGHINSLVEEYTKMAGFVRATRNGQFNESAQQLVNEGLQHYQSLKESLSRMSGHRGYNMYFESWTPSLMEDETDTTSINELFVQETLDPRIESVMPILSKLHKKVSEMKEVSELSEWADSLLEGGDGGEASEEPTFTEPVDELPAGGNDAPIDDLDESLEPTLDDVLARHSDAVEKFKQGGDMDYDLESDLWDYYFTSGDIKNYDADASEFLSQKLADHLGIDESLDESGLQAYLGNKKYGKEGMDALRKAGRDGASKETMAKIRAKYDKLDEEGMMKSFFVILDDSLIDQISNMDGAEVDPDSGTVETWNENTAKQLSVFAQKNPTRLQRKQSMNTAGMRPMAQRVGGSNTGPEYGLKEEGLAGAAIGGIAGAAITKTLSGAMAGAELGSKLQDKFSNKEVDEGALDTLKKVGKKVLDKIAPGDEELLRQLQKSAGIPQQAQHSKPSMAKPNNEGVAEGLTDNDIARTAYMYGLKHGREGVGNNMDRAKAEWGDNFKHYNAGFLKGRNEKSKGLKAAGQGYGRKQQGVAEDLDANQKRVGQLGPTEKVGPKGAVGKLVGANENFINTDVQSVVTEVDTGEYDARKSTSKGETTPEQEKEFRKKVQAYGKELEQRQKEKEKVKEGQEDLDAILRIVRK
jgi:hypothetical protein